VQRGWRWEARLTLRSVWWPWVKGVDCSVVSRTRGILCSNAVLQEQVDLLYRTTLLCCMPLV
jgi:hypothetical protein